MAFIDCDEFLMPRDETDDIVGILDKTIGCQNCRAGAAINWVMYGSNGHKIKPRGLVIDSFVKRANLTGKGNDCVKTIVKPSKVIKFAHPHYPIYKFGYYAVSLSGKVVVDWRNPPSENPGLRINHYFTKSMEEWLERRSLGYANNQKIKRSIEEFYLHDQNDVLDDIARRYSIRVNDIMSRSDVQKKA